MAQLERFIGAAALRDVGEVREFGAGSASVVESVENDGPRGVRLPDGGNGRAHDRFVRRAGHAAREPREKPRPGRFVEQIETQPPGRDARVAPRQGLPVQAEGVPRRRMPPEIEGLAPFAADAVTGGAVKIQAEMESMAFREFHGPVEPRKRGTGFVDAERIAVLYPERVRERQPHEIKSPPGDPPEIVFLKRLRAVCGIHLQ